MSAHDANPYELYDQEKTAMEQKKGGPLTERETEKLKEKYGISYCAMKHGV